MTFLGPYVAATTAIVGFALFAAIHHIHLWFTRRERSSFLFAACCVTASAVCASHVVVATATSVETGQLALNIRTTFGLLTHVALVWLIGSISGVRPAVYQWGLTTLLVAGVLINVFAFPLIGTVDRIERLTLPWGESVALLTRSASSAWLTRVMFGAVGSVQVYALVGSRAMWRRDRTAATLMALAGCAGLVSSAVGVLVDTQAVRAPYVGQFAISIWIGLMAILLSHSHAQRGELLEISERRLTMSEARYRTLIEYAPEAIVVLDVEAGCFVDLNEQACRLFGLPAAELRKLNPVALSPPWQADGRGTALAARQYIQETLNGGSPVFEWLHRTPDGRDLPCEVRLVKLPDPQRSLVRGSITDISARLHLEAQLRQSQKMEAVGQLAAGVAHDFNNLMTIIAGNAELLHLQLEASDPRRESVDAIQDASGRAASLTERLLAFSRRKVLSPRLVDFNRVVLDAEPMLRRLLGDRVDLIIGLPDGPNVVRIDPELWSQVLLNLAINARDAMPGGGRLTIASSAVGPDASAASFRPGGPLLKVSVTDTGSGINPDVKDRIFEPFFTTKPVGSGTGLGLAVVHGIVTQAGGLIDVVSVPGAGTTFDLYVPLVEHPDAVGRHGTPVRTKGSSAGASS